MLCCTAACRTGQALSLVLVPPPDTVPLQDGASSSSDSGSDEVKGRGQLSGQKRSRESGATDRSWDGLEGENWKNDGYGGYWYHTQGGLTSLEGKV